MSLSVIIITLNEERNIERCLQSVAGVADEIVVVDSYSTDKTEEICARYGVRFLQRKFDGYGNQKRYATEQANFDYVLSLDADEALSAELRQSILTEKEHWSKICYSFNIRNHYCGTPIRFCGWYPDVHIRLFNKSLINWTKTQVHESIEVTNKKDVMWLKGDLLHYTCTSIAEHQEKEQKYARMNAAILAQKGKLIFWITPFLRGAFRFFKIYILKLGVLDGYYGFVISRTLSKSSYRKYALAREIINSKKKQISV